MAACSINGQSCASPVSANLITHGCPSSSIKAFGRAPPMVTPGAIRRLSSSRTGSPANTCCTSSCKMPMSCKRASGPAGHHLPRPQPHPCVQGGTPDPAAASLRSRQKPCANQCASYCKETPRIDGTKRKTPMRMGASGRPSHQRYSSFQGAGMAVCMLATIKKRLHRSVQQLASEPPRRGPCEPSAALPREPRCPGRRDPALARRGQPRLAPVRSATRRWRSFRMPRTGHPFPCAPRLAPSPRCVPPTRAETPCGACAQWPGSHPTAGAGPAPLAAWKKENGIAWACIQANKTAQKHKSIFFLLLSLTLKLTPEKAEGRIQRSSHLAHLSLSACEVIGIGDLAEPTPFEFGSERRPLSYPLDVSASFTVATARNSLCVKVRPARDHVAGRNHLTIRKHLLTHSFAARFDTALHLASPRSKEQQDERRPPCDLRRP